MSDEHDQYHTPDSSFLDDRPAGSTRRQPVPSRRPSSPGLFFMRFDDDGVLRGAVVRTDAGNEYEVDAAEVRQWFDDEEIAEERAKAGLDADVEPAQSAPLLGARDTGAAARIAAYNAGRARSRMLRAQRAEPATTRSRPMDFVEGIYVWLVGRLGAQRDWLIAFGIALLLLAMGTMAVVSLMQLNTAAAVPLTHIAATATTQAAHASATAAATHDASTPASGGPHATATPASVDPTPTIPAQPESTPTAQPIRPTPTPTAQPHLMLDIDFNSYNGTDKSYTGDLTPYWSCTSMSDCLINGCANGPWHVSLPNDKITRTSVLHCRLLYQEPVAANTTIKISWSPQPSSTTGLWLMYLYNPNPSYTVG